MPSRENTSTIASGTRLEDMHLHDRITWEEAVPLSRTIGKTQMNSALTVAIVPLL
jgi:hypothetical protein